MGCHSPHTVQILWHVLRQHIIFKHMKLYGVIRRCSMGWHSPTNLHILHRFSTIFPCTHFRKLIDFWAGVSLWRQSVASRVAPRSWNHQASSPALQPPLSAQCSACGSLWRSCRSLASRPLPSRSDSIHCDNSPNRFICRGSHGLGRGEGLVWQLPVSVFDESYTVWLFLLKLPGSCRGVAGEQPASQAAS